MVFGTISWKNLSLENLLLGIFLTRLVGKILLLGIFLTRFVGKNFCLDYWWVFETVTWEKFCLGILGKIFWKYCLGKNLFGRLGNVLLGKIFVWENGNILLGKIFCSYLLNKVLWQKCSESSCGGKFCQRMCLKVNLLTLSRGSLVTLSHFAKYYEGFPYLPVMTYDGFSFVSLWWTQRA